MADPRWTRLDSIRRQIVPLLANALDGGDFLDALLTLGCVSHDQEENIRRRLREVSLEDVARHLLTVLRRTPPRSFNSFCTVLKQGNDDRKALYACIASATGLAHESRRLQKDKTRISHGTKQVARGRKHSSGIVSKVRRLKSVRADSPDFLTIHVHEKLKAKWKPNKKSFIAIIKGYAMVAAALPARSILVNCSFQSSMTLISESDIPIDESECLLRICFPETTTKRFKQYQRKLLRRMSNLLKIEMKKIDISAGSCLVDLTVTGTGFINFICGLHAASNFAHLIIFDSLATLQIGPLPPVKLVALLRFGQLQSVSEAFSLLGKV